MLCTYFGKGRQHDFRLWKQSQLVLPQQVTLWADTGYQGMHKLHAKTGLPHNRKRGQPLSTQKKRENQEKAKKRMRVEQVIGALKRFRLFAEKYRNRRKRFSLRVNLIAVWYNLDLL